MSGKPSASTIKAYLLDRLEQSITTASSRPIDLTIGIEQEFFLLFPDGSPSDHALGQAFLSNLSNIASWCVFSRCNGPFGEMIDRVSREEGRGRFTAVKYDHHPHLFEIAFGYQDDLHALNISVYAAFQALNEAAENAGATILQHPFGPVPASDPRVVSPMAEFCELRKYRRRLLARQGIKDARWENYAAEIAATQVHIGGTQWWKHPGFVESLYSRETEMLAIAYSAWPSELRPDFSYRRWAGYSAVFGKHPLVGFPLVTSWNLETWAEALTRSPLAHGPAAGSEGSSLEEVPGFPFDSISEFWASARDLQIIRPKPFGTLEFRADPAQPTVADIMKLAAYRLAQCILANQASTQGLSFQECALSWWSTVQNGPKSPSSSITEAAATALRLRNLGEETYLCEQRIHSLDSQEERRTGTH